MLKLPSLDLVFSSNRGELETLGTTYPAETVSPGNNAPQTGAKTSASKAGMPGIEMLSHLVQGQVLFLMVIHLYFK